MSFASTYRNRTVLVTGHTGFKAGWLCNWLLELGAKPIGLALEPESRPNLFETLHLVDRMTSRIADIREGAAVRRIVAECQPEIVFHLAAQPLVRRSYTDPIGTFGTNVIGTAHVLDAARHVASVRAIVCVTTDKVYENREWAWPYREIDPLGGIDPYSASKAGAELVTAVYQKNLCRGKTAIATARGGNVIGGGDWSVDRIVPDIVRAVSAGAPIALRNPQAVRPWQHVLEVCEGYLELGAHLFESGEAFAEAWNFGPHSLERMTVGELTTEILKIWGRPDHPVKVESSGVHETQILRLDIAKALSRLSWRPRLGMHEALIWTTRWYKAYYEDPKRGEKVTQEQIRKFGEIIDSARGNE